MIRPRRSCLFVPADNARALPKARGLDADAVMIDLEDAVAPEAKVAARDAVRREIEAGGFGRREVVLRVNALGTEWAEEDLKLAASLPIDAVLLPKVEGREAIATARAATGRAVWAMIETPRAILDLKDIAAAGASCFVAGTNDLAKALRCGEAEDRLPLLPALSAIVTAARAFGLDAIDGVENDIADEPRLARACAQGRLLGFDGKSLIHPSQIAAANAAFAPTEEEIARARAIRAAFDDPANAGKGVLKVEGRMVERLHYEAAQRTLALAAAIA